MKKNEIALLILIVVFTGVIVYFSLNSFMGQAVSKPVQVEKAEAISGEVTTPSEEVFYNGAINPTVKVSIGNNTDRQPFTLQ